MIESEIMSEENIASDPSGHEPDGSFSLIIGKTVYDVRVFFSRGSKETTGECVKELIRKRVESGEFE